MVTQVSGKTGKWKGVPRSSFISCAVVNQEVEGLG